MRKLRVDVGLRQTSRFSVVVADGTIDWSNNLGELVMEIEAAAALHKVDEVEIDPAGIGAFVRKRLSARGNVKVLDAYFDDHPYA